MRRAPLLVFALGVLIAAFARTLGLAGTLLALLMLAAAADHFWPLEADDETQ